MIRAGSDVGRLVESLGSSDRIRRDAAIARLRVIGPRAVGAVTRLVHGGASTEARTAGLKALEGIDDPRVVDAALPLLSPHQPTVTGAAIGVLRAWVTRETGTRVLDALTAVALDTSRDPVTRLAALDAIAQLPRHVVAPLLEQAAVGAPGPAGADDPAVVQEWLAANADAPLSELHALIVRLRDYERAESAGERRDQWIRARGAAHALLARRRSRVALYDLRETFDAARAPLPLDYLAAMTLIGDASCLEPMARAWAAVPADPWWRERLSEAAADIRHRTRLSGSSAALKRIRAKWPGFL